MSMLMTKELMLVQRVVQSVVQSVGPFCLGKILGLCDIVQV